MFFRFCLEDKIELLVVNHNILFLSISYDMLDGFDDYFQVHHLLPNILIGTGKYCRSSKYHDKSVDQANLTENGYLVTGSEGSKYLKIWKIKTPLEYGYSVDEESPDYDLEQTEVRELQILRDHSDYLTVVKVFGNTIYSSCSDGEVRKNLGTFSKLSTKPLHFSDLHALLPR